MNVMSNTIKGLHPAHFAMVMSTGIISVAAKLLGFTGIAYALFYINIVAYAILLPILVLRIIFYWDLLYKDLSNPKLSFVFFTVVAGTNVLGAQFVSVINQPEIAKIFWYFGIFLWAVISLLTFSILFLECSEGIEKVVHGGWLIATVGTQSVAVLGGILAPKFGCDSFVLFTSFVFWMIGSFLYMILITLLFYRLVFFKFTPEAFVPPYWINMGALAITTLAGSILCLSIPKVGGAFSDFLTFTKGFTLFFWSFGTWWIPLLFILAFWKYVFHRTQFTYSPLYWGMVFPLGMYTACTYKLSQALQLPFLMNIPKYSIYIAFIAWIIISISMLIAIYKTATAKETTVE
ncbi:MAG: tellurite resistance/C4-dicarboxylate transporter family protein [Candidatus Scalindua sp.]